MATQKNSTFNTKLQTHTHMINQTDCWHVSPLEGSSEQLPLLVLSQLDDRGTIELRKYLELFPVSPLMRVDDHLRTFVWFSFCVGQAILILLQSWSADGCDRTGNEALLDEQIAWLCIADIFIRTSIGWELQEPKHPLERRKQWRWPLVWLSK